MSKVLCSGCGKYLSRQHATLHSQGKGSLTCRIAQAKGSLGQGQPPTAAAPVHPFPTASTTRSTAPVPVEEEDWPEQLALDADSEVESDLDEDSTDGRSEWDEDDSESELGADEAAAILEEWNRESMAVADHERFKLILTEEDRDNIKMFALRLSFKLTRRFHEKFRVAYADKIRLHSLYMIHRRITILSGIQPELYDCCPSSCCAYTGPLDSKTQCPYCSAPRYTEDGKPQARFEYLPLIPRVQGFFANHESMARLRYRTERETSDDTVSDIFDGTFYQSLLGRHVTVNGDQYDHTFFDDWRDIPTGLMCDGFQLFKRSRRGHSSAWPFILENYGLSPEVRTHVENIIPLFVIAGPTTPKNFNSFMHPFAQESKKLAIGVPTFDVSQRTMFPMRSYPLTKLGDMIAIRYTQCMKGPNAFSPCRTCRIQGFRNVKAGGNTYYVPLKPPIGTPEHTSGVSWDPADLPLRTDAELIRQLADIRRSTTKEERTRKAMVYGINGESVLFEIPSFSRVMSFPTDGMHLLFQNHVKNMIKLWKGTYDSKLDEGKEEYVIEPLVWARIGQETAAAVSLLPSAFVSAMPNIWLDANLYTAEMWCFWILYVAPHVLKDRFKRRKYYTHMLQLVDIIKTILKFSITRREIGELRSKIIDYVETYEKYYYQYHVERLTVCRLTVHALLHIADEIERTGPVWVNWTFVMERFCGLLGPAVKSKRKPYACLSRRLLQVAQITQISLRFDMVNLLRFEPPRAGVSSHEHSMAACPDHILRWPKTLRYKPEASIRKKLVVYFRTMFNCPAETLEPILPVECVRWGSLRIADGGDTLRGKAALPCDCRDNSFIKYTLLVDKNARNHRRKPEYEREIFYGQLDFVVILDLPASPALGTKRTQTHALALVQTCKTYPKGGDAAKGVVSYTSSHPSIFINLNTVQCGVGRIKVAGNRWGIVDRTGDFVRATFGDGEDEEMA